MHRPAPQGAAGLVIGGLVVLIALASSTVGQEEDDCPHSSGAASPVPGAVPFRPGAPGGRTSIAACAPGDARENTGYPLETGADFVPVTGDDALGFYVVYSARTSTSGAVANNVGMFLFELSSGEVLLFGQGYGDLPDINLHDAAWDMARVDEVIRGCMGRDPASTPLRIVVPHGHADHVNPAACVALEALGYSIAEIAYHEGDVNLMNGMAWKASLRALFHELASGPSCGSELLAYGSPIGKLWFHSRPGHTDGSIDLVIDVRDDPSNRFVVRGSQANQICPVPPGTREAINAHGNVQLTAVEPRFTDLSPRSGSSLGGTPLVVSGQGFAAAGAGLPRVLLGGVAATGVVVVDGTKLTCTSPPGVAGRTVTVVLVDDNGSDTLDGTYTYNPTPTVTGVSPDEGDPAGGTAVTITGTRFTGAGTNEVWFGTRRATNVVVSSATSLTCRTPLGTAGTSVAVRVRNGDGQGTLPGGYTYAANLAITGLQPPSGTSLGGTRVTLTGLNLGQGSTPPAVTFGNAAATAVTVVSDTSVSCTAPRGAPGTTVAVVLTGPLGSTSYQGFRYHALPRITGITPSSSGTAGEITATLSGSGFLLDRAGVNTVRFAGVAASSVQVQSDTSLTCVVPPGNPGTVGVVVGNANGNSSARSFTYLAPPTLDGVEPDSGSPLGGTRVTLSGSGFAGADALDTAIAFGAQVARDVVVLDDAHVACTAPPGTPGSSVGVVLRNANGSASLADAFRYSGGPPRISDVQPARGPAIGGTAVVIRGGGFLDPAGGLTRIFFGDGAASDVVVLDDGRIACRTPAGAVDERVTLSLRNGNGVATLVDAFTYDPNPPTLAALGPISGPATGATTVTLTGSGFRALRAGTHTVTFGGVAATDVVVFDDTRLTCRSPAGTPGARVEVRVENHNGEARLPSAFRYHALPALTAVTPARAAAEGTTVTLTGRGFRIDLAGANTVAFGGVAATGVSVANDTTITCTAPPGTPGSTVDVVVRNANGSATLPDGFRYHARPALASVAPARGPSSGATALTVTGSGFLVDGAGANTLELGGARATSVVVVSDTRITCVAPPGTPGTTVALALSNANGEASLANAYAYNRLPTLTAVTPSTGTALGGTGVTLSGTGFTSFAAGASTVLFDGVPATSVLVASDTSLTCVTPRGAPGARATVEVVNTNGTARMVAGFGYAPAPALASITPASAPGSGGTTVTLTGSALAAGGILVTFGGIAATNVVVVDDTRVRCRVPAGAPGSIVGVALANENGTASLPAAFRYHALPTLSAASPSTGSTAGPVPVTLTGSGFVADQAGPCTVLFGVHAASGVSATSDSTLTCMAPPGAEGSVVTVSVTNANGRAELRGVFTYAVPVPLLAAVSPAGGSAEGGTTVTLTGARFLAPSAGTTRVRFGDLASPSVTVLSDSTLACTAPAGSPGVTVDVTVENEHGSATLPAAFRFAGPPPVLVSLSPDDGTAMQTPLVTLTGTGFQAYSAGATTVTFGGLPATSVGAVSDTRVYCRAPKGTAGTTVDVVIANANGSSVLAEAYRYHVGPTLTSVSPADGSSLGGTTVTVRGSGFLVDSPGANSVRFNGVGATRVTVVDDTTLTCRSPSGPPGATVDVTLANTNGTAALPGSYRYHARPSLTSVTPGAGTSLGGKRVVLTGSGFTSDGATLNVVAFGGVAAAAVTVVGDTTIECDTPAGTAGLAVQVSVSNVNGTASLSSAYRYHLRPSLTAAAPRNGDPNGATLVALSGAGFVRDDAGPCTVAFDGAPATELSVASDGSLTCRTPSGTAGSTVDVVLTNANGSATLAGAFQYDALAPLVASVQPARGTVLGATPVTLTGAGFDVENPPEVTFGGARAGQVRVTDARTLCCLTPPGSAGDAVDVSVRSGDGEARLAQAYRYVEPPLLARVEPAVGEPAGGALVALLGSGFERDGAGTNTVTVGGVPATVKAVNDERILVEVPPGEALREADVVVQNENGRALLARGFRWQHALRTDVDHDGRGDLLVAGRGPDADAAVVHVFFGGELPGLDRTSSAPDLLVAAERGADALGGPVVSGDVDGDGIADLVVGIPGDDGAGEDAGAVLVFAGPLRASVEPLPAERAVAVLRGAAERERLGSTLVLCDLDRDGALDLLAGGPGDPRQRDAGVVRVFRGGSGGLTATPEAAFPGCEGGEDFAASLAASDLDGDGWPELFVGAPGALDAERAPSARGKLAGDEELAQGAVLAYHGGPALLLEPAREPWTVWSGEHGGDDFGSALAAADLDGDGIDDLVVGARGASASGAVFAFRGRVGIAGVRADASDWTLAAEQPGDRFGAALALGDASGDGLADLMVGAPGAAGTGRAYLFLGGRLGHLSAAQADIQLSAEPLEGEFGATVALVDVNGDGRSDLVVGAPSLDDHASGPGRVYVFSGAAVLSNRSAADDDATLTGTHPGEALGRAVSSDH